MSTVIAHITPLEAPIVWLAFAAGLSLGALTVFLLMQKRATKRS